MADEHDDSCPFCRIAQAYPPPSKSPTLSTCIPSDPDADKLSPRCNLVLSAPHALAFLDIMPMTRAHLLVTSRAHRVKASDLSPPQGAAVGFWLPLLARAVMRVAGVDDYNIVQNNGARAAQVVPHVHFHIIPRPGSVPAIEGRSWTMFGKGQRGDMSDEEGDELAAEIRRELADVVKEYEESQKKANGKL